MKQAFEVAGAMIFSLGGGAAIVLALSSWLGKVWANRILEKEKAEHSKEIEYYKSELNKELNHFNAIQDKALYVSKAQYDNEYKIYQEIWEKMFELMETIKGFSIVKSYTKDETQKIINETHEKYQAYQSLIDRYSLFYKEEFILKFKKILVDAGKNIKMFFEYCDKDQFINIDLEKRNKLFSCYKKIYNNVDNLKIEIKDYLSSLCSTE